MPISNADLLAVEGALHTRQLHVVLMSGKILNLRHHHAFFDKEEYGMVHNVRIRVATPADNHDFDPSLFDHPLRKISLVTVSARSALKVLLVDGHLAMAFKESPRTRRCYKDPCRM